MWNQTGMEWLTIIVLISCVGSVFIIRSPSLFFDYWRSNLPFSRESDGKKEKSVVPFTHGQNIICSQTLSPAKNV